MRCELCHHFPGYTLDTLRTLTWREFTALAELMVEHRRQGTR